jgi:hypothetical protein
MAQLTRGRQSVPKIAIAAALLDRRPMMTGSRDEWRVTRPQSSSDFRERLVTNSGKALFTRAMGK